MSALGQSLLVAAIMIGAMSAVFAHGIPGLALALVGIVIGLFLITDHEPTPAGVVFTVSAGLWFALGCLGLHLGALHPL